MFVHAVVYIGMRLCAAARRAGTGMAQAEQRMHRACRSSHVRSEVRAMLCWAAAYGSIAAGTAAIGFVGIAAAPEALPADAAVQLLAVSATTLAAAMLCVAFALMGRFED